MLVDGAGDQLLAGPAFAGDEDREHRVGHAGNLVVDGDHGASGRAAGRYFHRGLTARGTARLTQRSIDGGLEVADVERLAHIVECARAGRSDRGFERAKPADQEHLPRGIHLLERAQHIQPRQSGRSG